MLSDFGSKGQKSTPQEGSKMKSEKRHSISRLQKLKKRLSASFSRLSLSKDGIIPELDHENDNVEVTKITMNGLAGEGLRSTYSYISLPLPPPSSLHTLDNVTDDSSMLGLREPNGNITATTSYHSVVNEAVAETIKDHMCYEDHEENNINHNRRSTKDKRCASTEILSCASTVPDCEKVTISSDDLNSNYSKSADVQLRKKPRPKSEFFLPNLTSCNSNQNSNMPSSHRYSSAFGGNSPFGRTEAYVKLEQLGEGSYATVYKGYSNLMNKVVALKEITLQQEEGTPFTAIREASLLRGLKHANIVTLHDIIHTKETLTFVFEFVNTDLSHYLERHHGGLHPRNVKLFLFQLLRGLAYCHERRVLHRDLKPQNLLISEVGELKLADFGLARAKSVPSRTYSHEVVTLWYRPPDVLLGSTDYSTSLDMWGVGCIFLEMITGAATFPGVKDTSDQLDKIWRILGTPTEETWEGVTHYPHYRLGKYRIYKLQKLGSVFNKLANIPDGEKLATHFLQLQPHNRISAHDALRNVFFCDLPDNIFEIPDHSSIFTLPGCKISSEANHHPISVIKAAAKLRA